MNQIIYIVFSLNTLFSFFWISVVFKYIREQQLAFPRLLLVPFLFWDVSYFIDWSMQNPPFFILTNYILWIGIDLFLLFLTFRKSDILYYIFLTILSALVAFLVLQSPEKDANMRHVGTLLYIFLSLGSLLNLIKIGRKGQPFIGFWGRFGDSAIGVSIFFFNDLGNDLFFMTLRYCLIVLDILYIIVYLNTKKKALA